MKKRLSPYYPGIILFVLFLVISVFTFKDYGIAWDEPIQEEIGTVYYNYVVHNDQKLLTYDSKVYGAGFELPLIFLERIFHLKDSRDIYLMRHFVTHLFFLLSAFCAYILCYRLFRNRYLACLGFIMLACNPRIYAHSFFNTKDIPLLCMFIITFMLAQIAFEKNTEKWYVLLGMACGYTISIRIMGIILPAMLSLFFIADIITSVSAKKKPLNVARNFLLFIVVCCASLYISWPTLWHDPVKNLLSAYKVFSHFSFWDGPVLFMGQVYHGTTIPWYYAPVWFGISTPVLWLALGLTGLLLIAVAFVRKPQSFLTNTNSRNFVLYIACLFTPFSAVIFLHSVVYDDWRHLYFIYPAFTLIVLFAVNKILQTKGQYLISTLCIVQVYLVAVFMVGNHPFQQVYFNRLVSNKEENLRKNYELEYWGNSYKQAFDHILAHDNSPVIRVFWSTNPVINNFDFLPAQYRSRFVLVNRSELPYYFITNFRGHSKDFTEYPEIFYNVKVMNSSIMRVYKCY